MSYVDGFVLAVPKKHLGTYRKIATKAGNIWREHGALDYKECVGDDLDHKGMVSSFSKIMKQKKGELILFSFIVYRSRKHRDSVNKKVMKDPRMLKMMNQKDMPFEMERMVYGGFKVIVDKH